MKTLILILALVVSNQVTYVVSSDHCVEDQPTLSKEDFTKLIDRHYTDNQIVASDSPSAECSMRVQQERDRYKEQDIQTIGIVPTVSFGAAITIFVAVGIFAAIIAQCFQMVNKTLTHLPNFTA